MMIQHVIVNGNWIVWNKQVIGIDQDEVMRRAAAAAKKLWGRMHGK